MASYDKATSARRPVEIDLQSTTADPYTAPLYRTTYMMGGAPEYFTNTDLRTTLDPAHQPPNVLIGTCGFVKPANTPDPDANAALYLFAKSFADGVFAYRVVYGNELSDPRVRGWLNQGIIGYGSRNEQEPGVTLVPLLRYQWLGEAGGNAEGSDLCTHSNIEIKYIGDHMQTQFAVVDEDNWMFVEPTTIELQIVPVSSTDDTPTTDRAKANESTVAQLQFGASLVIGVNEYDYPQARIEQVDFHAVEDGPTLFTYTLADGVTPHAVATPKLGPTNATFTVSKLGDGVVRITDNEPTPSPNTEAWYSVTFSFVKDGRRITKTLDPELTNKSGGKTGGGQWGT